jgi:U3 small nucleolar RNA-associated protein 22
LNRQIPRGEFIAAFRDVFVDITGTINVWATWEQGELQLVSSAVY